MRRVMMLSLLLLSAPVLAQKPWEARVDLPVPVPLELPAVPLANPFAVPVASPPSVLTSPLREKFTGTFTVLASAYVSSEGSCRRVVFTRMPFPGMDNELRQTLSELNFIPARAGGAPVPAWLPLAIDLKGRVKEGRVTRLQAASPDPNTPPVPEEAAAPAPDARDQNLPATPLARVEQLASPKRPPRIRVDGRMWRQSIRVLADVSTEGRCQRVVFLTCPEGLRPWLLASMGAWTFRPAAGTSGPVQAWALLEGEVEVEIGDLASEGLRVMHAGS